MSNTNMHELDSKLDRDSVHRVNALRCAVKRAGQNGVVSENPIDVLALAEIYYGWLTGEEQAQPGNEADFIKEHKNKN